MDEAEKPERSSRDTFGDKRWRGGGKPGRKMPRKLLTDYQWVYDHPEEYTNIEARAKLQQMFREDPKAFVTQMASLQRQIDQAKRTKTPKNPFPVNQGGSKNSEKDEGLERLNELLAEEYKILEKVFGEKNDLEQGKTF